MICSNCQKTLKDGARFCPYCGTPVLITPPNSNFFDGETQVLSPEMLNPKPQPEVQPQQNAEPQGQPLSQGQPVPQMQQPQGQQIPPVQPYVQPQGQQVPPAQPYVQPQGQQIPPKPAAPAKKKKKWLIPVIIVGAVTLLLVGALIFLILFVFKNQKVTVDFNNYLDVTFEGYDGYGEADWTLDEQSFREDFGDKLKWTKKGFDTDPVEVVLNSAYPSLSEVFDLKNGDIIDIVWELNTEVSEYINVELVAEDRSLTVSGLSEAKTFDPFETLEITYSGHNGSGRVENAEFTGTDPVYDSLYLDSDWWDYENLSNGDEISFSIDIDGLEDYLVLEYGMIPSVTSKTVVVEGLQDIETFDPFEGLELIFEGMNGSGYISSLNVENCDPACENIYYDYPWDSDLSNGDEVLITIDEDDYTSEWFAEEYGKVPNVFEKTFTVSGLEEKPVFNDNELSLIPEERLNAFDEALINVYRDDIMSQYEENGFTMVDMLPLGNRLLIKDPESDSAAYDNILYSFYQLEVEVDGQEDHSYVYIPLYITDIDYETFEFDVNNVYFATDEKVHLENTGYYLDLAGFDSYDRLFEVSEPGTGENVGMLMSGSTLPVG